MRIVHALAALFVLSACSRPAEVAAPAQPPEPPAPAALEADTRVLLVECAGAIAAAGDVDPMREPQADSAASNNLWTVLALMDKEPGLEGMEGRRQAAAARARWEGRPQAEAQGRADACMARFSAGQ